MTSRLSRIFISYRREDSGAHAGRLHDAFEARFGSGTVFLDIDTIPPGADFTSVLAEAVASCDVLVVVIGKEWAGLRGVDGRRRLDDPNDYVRFEIRSALARDVPVIPALVAGATVPRVDELPDDIAELAKRNAVSLHDDSSWSYGVQQITNRIDQITGGRAKGSEITGAKPSLEERSARARTLDGKLGWPSRILAMGIVASVVGVVVILFHSNPGPSCNDAVTLDRVIVTQPITRRGFLEVTGQRTARVSPQRLQELGARVQFNLHTTGYAHKQLQIGAQTVNASTGTLAKGNDPENRRAQTFVPTPTKCTDQDAADLWLPLPPTAGHYAVEAQVTTGSADEPLVQRRSEAFQVGGASA
jgi:hypothetical protein